MTPKRVPRWAARKPEKGGPMSSTIVSSKKRRANRLNSRKSTGPRSVPGKATSSRNATSHGIFCADLVLPGESHEIFHALRQAFILQQRPQNVVELLIVDRLGGGARGA